MSSVRSQHTDLDYGGLVMRADEYFALGETQDRYELINGLVVMSPSLRPRHYKIVEAIMRQLEALSRNSNTYQALDIYVEIDLCLDDLTVYRPDMCVYARPPFPETPERLTTPPDFVLELLSPGSKALDLITKRDAYEEFGVKEYIVINPVDAHIWAWALENGRFAEMTVEGDRLVSRAFSGFSYDMVPIRERASRK